MVMAESEIQSHGIQTNILGVTVLSQPSASTILLSVKILQLVLQNPESGNIDSEREYIAF